MFNQNQHGLTLLLKWNYGLKHFDIVKICLLVMYNAPQVLFYSTPLAYCSSWHQIQDNGTGLQGHQQNCPNLPPSVRPHAPAWYVVCSYVLAH